MLTTLLALWLVVVVISLVYITGLVANTKREWKP